MVAALASAASAEGARTWGARLLAGPVLWFPIRHHSPACAWHLRRLIEERRPEQVLIEGPANFDEFRDLLAHPDTVPPVALYSYCNVRDQTAGTDSARLGAYYPLSAYSPEWVALHAAKKVGAAAHFIDLRFAAQTRVDHSDRLTGRVATLLGEQWFRRSAYLRTLAASLGCRDTDELWDRLFEVWARELSTEQFVSQVATYCELARRGVSDEEHERDGTTAREAEMAWHIAQAVKARKSGPILVVTGGYHTVALPELAASKCSRPSIDQSAIVSADTVLVRYSFDRLDRTNGYGAGMPAPAFYQRVWENAEEEAQLPLAVLAEIAYRAREEGVDSAPSTASVIAALEQVMRLAALRGNRRPTRSDLWDAIESCFLQGAALGEGRPIVRIAHSLLTGNAVGSVPEAAGLPPIVADFYVQAKACRLKVDDTDTRQLALDVYSDERARKVSRLLHRLQFIDVSFASRLSGPSLTTRSAGKRLREVWQYGWSPLTESALIDAAAYGSTIQEAVAQRFAETLKSNVDDGTQRSAQVAAERLATACLLGLHEQVVLVMQWLRSCVREDPAFGSVAAAVHSLVLLWQAREPLDAAGLEDVPELARAAFDRAAFLARELASFASDQAPEAAASLVSMREVLVGSAGEWFDAELLWQSVEAIVRQPTGEPSIVGAAAGMLYSAGRMDESQLGALLAGRLPEDSDGRAGVGILRGMLLATREIAWQSQAVMKVLCEVIEARDDASFVKVLPDLRLALAVLTPTETDHLARAVAGTLGITRLTAAVDYDLSAGEVQKNLELSLQLKGVLERDGLGGWLAGGEAPIAGELP